MRSLCGLSHGHGTGTAQAPAQQLQLSTLVSSVLSCSLCMLFNDSTADASHVLCTTVLKRIVWGLPSDVWPMALSAAGIIAVRTLLMSLHCQHTAWP